VAEGLAKLVQLVQWVLLDRLAAVAEVVLDILVQLALMAKLAQRVLPDLQAQLELLDLQELPVQLDILAQLGQLVQLEQWVLRALSAQPVLRALSAQLDILDL